MSGPSFLTLRGHRLKCQKCALDAPRDDAQWLYESGETCTNITVHLSALNWVIWHPKAPSPHLSHGRPRDNNILRRCTYLKAKTSKGQSPRNDIVGAASQFVAFPLLGSCLLFGVPATIPKLIITVFSSFAEHERWSRNGRGTGTGTKTLKDDTKKI